MKKHLSKFLSCTMAATVALSFVACGGGNSGDHIVNDENTINVRAGKAGYGTTYTTALAEEFEKTFESQGYKVNVLPPIEGLAPADVYRDIYSGSAIDVYFVENVKAVSGVDGNYGKVLSDITDNVYSKPAIKFDGTEETITIEEKLAGFDIPDAEYEDKTYYIPFAVSVGGLAVNKKVLDDMKLSLPRTTNEMFQTADKIMETASETDTFPFTFSLSGNNYVHSTVNAWIAQYNGVEEFNKIYSFENADGTPMEKPYEVYTYDSLKYALESVYHFYDYNMAANGSSTDNFSTVQGKIMKGDAVFYSVGSWMFNEEYMRYSKYKNDIIFINAPVVSELGVKLFGSGTSYGFDDATCDIVLSTIIKYADENKLASEIKPLVDAELNKNIKIEDITTVCERRGITRINMNSNIVINENSQKKEIAELFLRFCASEDAGKVFSEEANASSPYTYKNPVSSEYQWINSVNRIMLNPYLKQIQNEERGVKERLSGATLFPKLGEYFAVSVYQQLVTKYNDNYSIVGNDSVYTNAASQALKNEYDYVKDRFDKGTWKI